MVCHCPHCQDLWYLCVRVCVCGGHWSGFVPWEGRWFVTARTIRLCVIWGGGGGDTGQALCYLRVGGVSLPTLSGFVFFLGGGGWLGVTLVKLCII